MPSDRQATVRELRERRVVAVIRLDGDDLVQETVAALRRGGISCIEITMTVPNAARAIRALARESGILVGAGTVTSCEAVGECVDAGAQFIVSPALLPEVISAAHKRGVAVIPGALTPTEVFLAWRAGGDLVKIFPAARLGPQFIADLKAPFPQIPLVPTGGITDKTVASYLDAGADVVCTGSWLLDPVALAERRFSAIEERARQLTESVSRWRPKHG